MCSSRVLLGLESSARAWLRDLLSRADVFESSPIRGCKYESYVHYISTYEQSVLLFGGFIANLPCHVVTLQGAVHFSYGYSI